MRASALALMLTPMFGLGCDEGSPVRVGPGASTGEAALEGEGEPGGAAGPGDGGAVGEEGGEAGEGEGEGGNPPGGAQGGPPPGATEGEGEGEPPDGTRPRVLNVFSPDGVSVTVHFDEPVDPTTAEAPAAYAITGEDRSVLPVVAARLERAEFVVLTLDPAAPIDPAVRYTCRVSGVEDLAGHVVDPAAAQGVVRRTQYLALMWHQHQPFYYDPARDEMSGPWVRKHATKDYWDMAAVVGEFPGVHVTINLTPVLLMQLALYLERMAEFVDVEAGVIDAEGFLARWEGRTDPWIDLLLKPTPSLEEASEEEIDRYFKGAWATVSTADAIMARFPEYEALRDKNRSTYTREDLLHLKVFFELAWFDPDFLDGPVVLEDGSTVDLSDVVVRDAAGIYRLVEPATEALARRLVVDNYKVMANVVDVHRRLLWDPVGRTGQVEVTTTPFYHPILPLIDDTDSARQAQPLDPLPSPPYGHAGDAYAQVAKAVRYHTDLFGAPPRGMWPGEGSVAESVVSAFVDAGVRWIATDQKVMERSGGPGSVGSPTRWTSTASPERGATRTTSSSWCFETPPCRTRWASPSRR